MRLKLLWVGKTQEPWVRAGIDEYAGRIRRYAPLEILEAREEKGAAIDQVPGSGCCRSLHKGTKVIHRWKIKQ